MLSIKRLLVEDPSKIENYTLVMYVDTVFLNTDRATSNAAVII